MLIPVVIKRVKGNSSPRLLSRFPNQNISYVYIYIYIVHLYGYAEDGEKKKKFLLISFEKIRSQYEQN